MYGKAFAPEYQGELGSALGVNSSYEEVLATARLARTRASGPPGAVAGRARRRRGQPAARPGGGCGRRLAGELPQRAHRGRRGRHGLGAVERRHPRPPVRDPASRPQAAHPCRDAGRHQRRPPRPRLLARGARRDRPHPGRLRRGRRTPRAIARTGPGARRGPAHGLGDVRHRADAPQHRRLRQGPGAVRGVRPNRRRGRRRARAAPGRCAASPTSSPYRARPDRALELLSEAEAICRTMDLASALAYNHKMRANVLYRAGRYAVGARDLHPLAAGVPRHARAPGHRPLPAGARQVPCPPRPRPAGDPRRTRPTWNRDFARIGLRHARDVVIAFRDEQTATSAPEIPLLGAMPPRSGLPQFPPGREAVAEDPGPAPAPAARSGNGLPRSSRSVSRSFSSSRATNGTNHARA